MVTNYSSCWAESSRIQVRDKPSSQTWFTVHNPCKSVTLCRFQALPRYSGYVDFKYDGDSISSTSLIQWLCWFQIRWGLDTRDVSNYFNASTFVHKYFVKDRNDPAALFTIVIFLRLWFVRRFLPGAFKLLWRETSRCICLSYCFKIHYRVLLMNRIIVFRITESFGLTALPTLYPINGIDLEQHHHPVVVMWLHSTI